MKHFIKLNSEKVCGWSSTSTFIFFFFFFNFSSKPGSLNYFHFTVCGRSVVIHKAQGALQRVAGAAGSGACHGARLFPVKQAQNSSEQITCITDHFLLFLLVKWVDVFTKGKKSPFIVWKCYFSFLVTRFANNNLNISGVTRTIKFPQNRINIDLLIKNRLLWIWINWERMSKKLMQQQDSYVFQTQI